MSTTSGSWRVNVVLQLQDFVLDVDLDGDTTPVALIGPNGSGKTTLLRTVAGAYRPEHGRVHVGEHVWFESADDVDLLPEQRRVGYVPQGYGLFPHLTVLDNVAFGWRTPGQHGQQGTRSNRASELLEAVGCPHLGDRKPASLSGGEQQRVALARALMIEPRILLLDEPLAALDAAARRTLRRYLGDRLLKSATPALVATHDHRDVTALGATVCAIERGKIVQRGSAEELTSNPATPFIAEFFDSDSPSF